MPEAEVGVFGGSGFYAFLEDVEEVELKTPYGKPSAPFVIGEIGGKCVAFLPRHGRNHALPCSTSSQIQAESATSVLRPGTLRRCRGFSSQHSKRSSSR